MADTRPECCKEEENLEFYKLVLTRDVMTVTKECQECERHHHVSQATPKDFQITGGNINEEVSK